MSAGTQVRSQARASTSGRAADRGLRLWQAFAFVSLGGLSWWYFRVHHMTADREFLFTSGIAGTVTAALCGTLSIRKRWAYQGVGRMSAWLTGHVYLGVVSAFAILLHSGFRLGGPLTAALFSLFVVTIASGVWGLAVARRLPARLTKMEENPVLIEDLLETRRECMTGLHELANGGSAEFRLIVRNRLAGEATSLTRSLRFIRKASTLAEELPAFHKEHTASLRGLKPHEHRAFEKAAEYALHANKMSAELLVQRTLRGWQTFHIVMSAGMATLAAAHIFAVFFF